MTAGHYRYSRGFTGFPGGAAAVIVALTLLVSSLAMADGYPPTKGEMRGLVLLKKRAPAPDEPFFDAEGNTLVIGDFLGKVVLLNFWATWCPPCIREMPSLDRLQAEMGGEDFTIVAISIDAGGKPVAEPFMRERLGLTNLDLYLDPRFAVWKAFRGGGLPATFVIDRQGRIVGVRRGEAKWDGPDAKALIRHLIEETVG